MEITVNPDPFPDIQGTYSFRAIEFVCRKGEHVDLHLLNVYFHITDRLNCIGVKQDIFLSTKRSNLLYGLNSPDLIVCKHD